MLLAQRFKMWSTSKIETAVKILQQFGDVAEMISYIDKMPYSHQIKGSTISVDDKYYVRHDKKSLIIHPIDDIMYCYISADVQHIPHSYVIGLMLKGKVSCEISSCNRNEILDAYNNFFCRFFPYLEQQPFEPCSFEVFNIYGVTIKVEDGKFTHFRKYRTFFRDKEKELVYYETDISNLIWCRQTHETDENGPGWSSVHMTFRDGKHIEFKMEAAKFPSDFAIAFKIIKELKKNVPHLLYGENDEYKRLFRKSPEMLYTLAKQKYENQAKGPYV